MVDMRSLKVCVSVAKRALRVSGLARVGATMKRRASAISLVIEMIVRGFDGFWKGASNV